MRLAVTLSYDGHDYLGSQIQSETKNTIFGRFEEALISLGIVSKVVASGRTDRGVHATSQVCHFDVPEFWRDTQKLKRSLNQKLPLSIRVKKIREVDAAFHARYHAKKRSYRYILKVAEPNPFESSYVTFVESFDILAVRQKMRLFVGVHDFAAFRKKGSDEKSTIREIFRAFVYEHRGYYVLYFEANGFLRSQIRLMVASLLRLSEEQILQALTQQTQPTLKPAPPEGLYLSRITY